MSWVWKWFLATPVLDFLSVKWGEISVLSSKIFVRIQWASTYKALNMVPGAYNIQWMLTVTVFSIIIWWCILFFMASRTCFLIHLWSWNSHFRKAFLLLIRIVRKLFETQIEVTILLWPTKIKNDPVSLNHHLTNVSETVLTSRRPTTKLSLTSH